MEYVTYRIGYIVMTKKEFQDFCSVLRLVLTGKESGLPLGKIIEILGKDKCIVLIEQFINNNHSNNNHK